MRLKFFLLFAGLTVLMNVTAFSQSGVAINTTGNGADQSAMLDISSNAKGLLIPRMATTERDAITLPATGLFIYNTTVNAFQVNTGTPATPIWSTLSTAVSGSFWSIAGNSGTTAAANFIGTTDNNGLSFRTNNAIRMSVGATGNIGIGITAPSARLHVFAPAGTNPLTLIGVTNGTNTST
ncbi:MAG: hypothetical protein ACTHJ5_12775, partial [Ilyomonas sp.]